MTTLIGSRAAEVQAQGDAKEKYAQAKDFFQLKAAPRAHSAALADAPPTTPDSAIATDQGAVQFHLIGHATDDPKYSKIMQQNADNLLAIGGLIHGYMTQNYPQVNANSIDINTWLGVINNIPDLALGNSVKKTYSNKIAGVSISGEFLSMIAKAIITDGASLLSDFTSYLNSIGNVTFSASVKQESYNVLTCTYLSYLVDDGVGGYYDYAAIALKQINFTEYFQELKSSCASEQYVNINLDYTEVVSLIQARRIREGGPDYQNFQGLVNANATAQFSNAKNFFNSPKNSPASVKPV